MSNEKRIYIMMKSLGKSITELNKKYVEILDQFQNMKFKNNKDNSIEDGYITAYVIIIYKKQFRK